MAKSGKPQRNEDRENSGEGSAQRKESGKAQPCDCEDAISAVSHRLRRQLLRRLNASDEPLSPARLARQMDVELGSVSYHMGILRECGVISMVDTRQVRGAMEHFYRSEVADHPTILATLRETAAKDENAD